MTTQRTRSLGRPTLDATMNDSGRIGVLAIEDDPRNAALLRAIVATTRFPLTTVGTLAEARERVAGGTVDLILLDRHLPDGDGLELARDLKGDPTTQAIPILLVSASVLPVDREAATAAGCDGFIDKPIRIDDLLSTLERYLG